MKTNRRMVATAALVALSVLAVAGCSSEDGSVVADATSNAPQVVSGESGVPGDVEQDLAAYVQTFKDAQVSDPDSYPRNIDYPSSTGERVPARSADATYEACSARDTRPDPTYKDVLVVYATSADKVYFVSSLLEDDFTVHESAGVFPVLDYREPCPRDPQVGELPKGHDWLGLAVLTNEGDYDVIAW